MAPAGALCLFLAVVPFRTQWSSNADDTSACRELRAKAGAPGEEMDICEGHSLSIADGIVTLLGEGDPSFFERAEEVEEFKVVFQSSVAGK